MENVFIFILLASVCLCSSYRKDGKFIIGAILPLTKPNGDGKCVTANVEGVAVAEAVVTAVDRISSDKNFKTLIDTTTIGYDIRDSCSNIDKERKHAYDMNLEFYAYKNDKKQPKPVDIVMSPFLKASRKSLELLNVEKIPQISYAKDNARLTENRSYVKLLASAYPEKNVKINVIVDLITRFGFDHVFTVTSEDFQGKTALKSLNAILETKNRCRSNIKLTDISSVSGALDKIEKNPLIKVIVIDCPQAIELEFYKTAQARNLTQLVILSTQDWYKKQNLLTPYTDVVEGMIYAEFAKEVDNFRNYLTALPLPYTGKDWIKQLYFSFGGKADCLNGSLPKRDANSEYCYRAKEATSEALTKSAPVSVFAFDAVYSIANALKSKTATQTLTEAINNLKFVIPLTLNEIVYTNHLTVTGSAFKIYNIQHKSINNKTKLSSTWLGVWNSNLPQILRIVTSDIRWKNGSKVTPLSLSSTTCKMGYTRSMNTKCSWDCKRCPNDTISNATNADVCVMCPKGYVAALDQSKCVTYKLETFHWFGSSGSFLIFLVVVGVCCVLFAFGIFSQNSDHELIRCSGYKMLCLYLLGCLLLFLSPIPLLVEPTVLSCSAYIAVFNMGLTIAFAVLFSRSAFCNGYYDENDVIKGGLGKCPRALGCCIVIAIQILILVIGLIIEPPETLHNDADYWNVRYFECSSWKNYIFWIGYGYNIALSIVGNFFNCSTTKMADNFEELKYVLITYCLFFLIGLFEIVLFYRYVDFDLAIGQAIMCILLGMGFYFGFIAPKIFPILFHSKDGRKLVHKSLKQDEEVHLTTAIHASDGYKHHGIVQMRLKEED